MLRVPFRRNAAVCLAMAAMITLTTSPQAHAQDKISLLTQNQYLGADLVPLLGVSTVGDFNAALVAALQQVGANDFSERVHLLAGDIAKRAPHLVGLQEVWSFDCFPQMAAACNHPTIAGAFENHLDSTLTALGQQGAVYYPAGIVRNFNLSGIPFEIEGSSASLVAYDRDVILARHDVEATVVDAEEDFLCAPARISTDGCNYSTVLTINTPFVGTPFESVPLERGFVGVDVTLGERSYRVVNTHLEIRQPDPSNPLSPAIQAAQAEELLTTLASTTPASRSLIVMGDINSSPEDEPINGIIPPFEQFLQTGFNDAWAPRKDAGYTCCQDKNLLNIPSELSERIDVIFSRQVPFLIKNPQVLGDKVGDKTALPNQGLWPSDHGSVAAEIVY